MLQRFERMCRYVIASVESVDAKRSQVAIALNKNNLVQWVRLVKQILRTCTRQLDDASATQARLILHLQVLTSMTSTRSWAILKAKQCEFRALIPCAWQSQLNHSAQCSINCATTASLM